MKEIISCFPHPVARSRVCIASAGFIRAPLQHTFHKTIYREPLFFRSRAEA